MTRKNKKSDRMWKYLVILGSMILAVFILANLMILISNVDNTKYSAMPPPDSDTRMLVIASHQDDETLIAGDYIIKTMENGGEVFVIYTVDGATRNDSMSDEDIKNIVDIRESEAKAALGLINVNDDNIVFLRNENRKSLMDAESLDAIIDVLGRSILDIDPDVIFISVYEGSHCDHDMTNFAVMTALERYGITGIVVYESPEYHNLNTLRDYLLFYSSKISLFKFKNRPEFVNNIDSEVFRLDMDADDLALKQSMFDTYKSQDVASLKLSHSGADTYRLAPDHDYGLPPYDYKDTFKYKFCTLRGKSGCDSFNICKISFDDMRDTIEAVRG